MTSNLFSKIKNVFTKNPEEKTPSKGPDSSRKSISFGDIISDEIRQFRRRGLSRKYQPYTRDEILQDSLESEKLFQLYKLIDETLTQSNEDLEGRNFSMYFKDSRDTASKRFYERFSDSFDKVDISSQEVLDLTNKVQGQPKEGTSPLFCIAMYGFYDQEEPVLEHMYPDLESDIGVSKEIKEWIEKNLAKNVMPDAVYNTPEDYLYFLVNVEKKSFEIVNKEVFEKLSDSEAQDNALLYGVSFFKQLPITAEVKEKYPNISRPQIQRAVCVLSKIPMFGRLVEHFQPLVKEHFIKNHPNELEAVKELYTQANPILKEITIDSHELQSNVHLKKLVCFLKDKTTTIWKALFLEKRVLVYSEHPSSCSTFIHTLLSLFPCGCHFNYHSRALTSVENHYGEYGLPLQILHDKSPLLPNFGLQHVEEIASGKGFLGGTSNFLIKTLSKVGWDIMIDIDTNTIHFKNDNIKRILSASKSEKDLITGILKKLEKKFPKENIAWSKLDNELFADQDDEVEYEGTEEWIRQKFYDHLKDLLTEIEFFRYHASAERLEPTLQVYNNYLAKKGEETEGKGSIIRLSTKSGESDAERRSEGNVDSASPSPFKSGEQQFFPNEEKKEEGNVEKVEGEKEENLQHKKSLDELQATIDKQSQIEERKDSRGSIPEVKEEDLNPDDPRLILKNELSPIKNSIKILRDYGAEWLVEWAKTDNFRNWAREHRTLVRERSANHPSAKDHFWSYENGDLYVGDIANGQRHGNGQYLYRHSRLLYKGGWENDKKSGNGMFSSLGGTELVYDGNFKSDKKDGFGRLIQGKERYVGTFVSDRYEGSGVLIDSEQNVYEGEFKDGYKWGMGKLKYANGETYLGEMMKDTFHGQGQYIYSNGDVYSGGFNMGKKNDYGILQIASGDIYEGQFLEDEFCGHGTLKKSDGYVYEGEFCRNQLVNGKQGIIRYPDGSKYVGVISDWKPHGEGVLIRNGENGEIAVRGRFENGELIEELREEIKKNEPVQEEKKEESKLEEPQVAEKPEEAAEEQIEIKEEERIIVGGEVEEVLLDERDAESDTESAEENKEVPAVAKEVEQEKKEEAEEENEEKENEEGESKE